MELKDLILKRKSIRNYEKKEVKSWIVGEILEAARMAPSSGNAQNWRFIVVRSPDVRTALAGAALRQYWMTTAPVFIVVCSDNSKIKTLYKKRGEKYARENCAVAATYMILKATELGLGSCWVGAFDDSKVSHILGLEEDITPEIILTLGYPEKKELMKASKRHALDKLVYFEKWKNRLAKPPMRLADYVKKGLGKLKKKK